MARRCQEVITEVEITAVGHGGAGIGRVDGQVCFVPYGLPGDRLEVKITRANKKMLWGEVASVLSASPDRTSPEYPGWQPSGVSTWLHFRYPAQAEWKQRIVRDCLARIAGISDVALEWDEDPALRTGYRTRAEFHGDGKRFGFYALGSHEIVDTAQCPLCHPAMNRALGKLRELEVKGSVTVTVNPEGEDVLVWTSFLNRKLRDRFAQSNTPRDERPPAMFLFDGVPVVNGAFSQSSLLLNRRLVSAAHEFAGDRGAVLDLYCGSGNLSLGLAERCDVLGLDHNKPAIRAARRTGRGRYENGNEARMNKELTEGAWKTVVLDPPRAGAKSLVPALASSRAESIVYVSCDPATLARDLKGLYEGGWRIDRIRAIDLFPNTPHVETVCLLARG